MSKICTSVEQSKKLIDLGIDVSTADMCWHRNSDGTYSLGIDDTVLQDDIPAWSIPALLELLPPYLFEFERGIDLNVYPNINGKGWHCSYMPNSIEDMKTDKFKKITNGDSLIDAVFKMVVWLAKK